MRGTSSIFICCAIFRPFKAELPHIQFIGRILRYIDDENATPIDNVGQIILIKI